MMVGGPDEAVERLAPILDVLAPPSDDEHGPGWGHFGPTGAGHYVKMVHNGVEYGMMQAYAEGFALFDACEYELDNAKIAHLWMQGSVVRSWLCELAARAFEQEGNDLANLEPYVEDSGEGRWTVEDAIDKRIPAPVLTTSLYERFSSRGQNAFAARLNAALRGAVRRPRRQGEGRSPDGHDGRREPSGRRARAAAGPPDDARHLRRHRRPGEAQAPAGDLQPRARGRAARALQPDRRLALGDERRRVPRARARVDHAVLAPRGGPAGARLAARPHSLRGRHVRRAVGLRAARRRARSSTTRRPASRSTASSTSRPRRRSSR